MAAAKWQQANGAKSAKIDQKRSETDRSKTAETTEKVQKQLKKQAKTGEKVRKRSGWFLVIVFCI